MLVRLHSLEVAARALAATVYQSMTGAMMVRAMNGDEIYIDEIIDILKEIGSRLMLERFNS